MLFFVPNNVLCCTSLVVIFVGGVHLCLEDKMTIGEFSALISLFRRIGRGVLRVNLCFVSIMRSTVALEDISRILNMPTGVVKLVKQQKQDSKKAKSHWSKLKQSVMTSTPAAQSWGHRKTSMADIVLSAWTKQATGFLSFDRSSKRIVAEDADDKESLRLTNESQTLSEADGTASSKSRQYPHMEEAAERVFQSVSVSTTMFPHRLPA